MKARTCGDRARSFRIIEVRMRVQKPGQLGRREAEHCGRLAAAALLPHHGTPEQLRDRGGVKVVVE